MKLNKDAIGIIQEVDDKQVAIATDKSGKMIEFKIKCKVSDLRAMHIMELFR